MTYDLADAGGGFSFTQLTAVSLAYNQTVAGQPAWGGDLSATGWQLITADLTSYAGHAVKLRFDFRSDSAVNYAGVCIDDVVITD